MKALVQRILVNRNYAKAKGWFRVITITSTAQILVQGLGFVSGILVLRLLSTKEYALYTLANTILGTMVILADGGIASGVMSQGGKVWKDREKLGQVMATGIALRKKFAIGSLLFAIPILFYLLTRHGASVVFSIMISLALIPAFLSALSADILQIVPKLHQDLRELQKIQVKVSVGRLVFTVFSLFIFPFSFIAIIAAGLPQIWANFRLKSLSKKFVDSRQNIDLRVRHEIFLVVRRILPGAIYYCLSAQVTIWLISVFGSTETLAQVGALGRLGMVFTFFATISNFLIEPRFSRLDNFQLLFKRFLHINCALLLLSCWLIFFVWLFSNKILWLFGHNYYGLDNQLLLFVAGSCLNFIAGVIFYLSSSRGWIVNPIISIPVNLIAIIFSAMIFKVSTLKGVLFFNISVACVNVFLQEIYLFYKIIVELRLILRNTNSLLATVETKTT